MLATRSLPSLTSKDFADSDIFCLLESFANLELRKHAVLADN